MAHIYINYNPKNEITTDDADVHDENNKVKLREDIFICKNNIEKAVVSLLLAEKIILNQNTPLIEKMIPSLYNDFCLLFTERSYVKPLLKILPRYLAKNSHSYHIWYQLILALLYRKKYDQVISAIEEILIIKRNDPHFLLLLSKVYIKTGKFEKSLEAAEKALKIGGFFRQKSYHLIAASYSRLSDQIFQLKEKQDIQKKAIEYFLKAFEIDKNNFRICYNLSLQYAIVRDIPSAFKFAKKALKLNPNYLKTWVLVILLFSASDQNVEAVETLQKASRRFVGDLKIGVLLLMYIKEGLKKCLDDLSNEAFSIMLGVNFSDLLNDSEADHDLKHSFQKGLNLLFLIVEIYKENKMYQEAMVLLDVLGKVKGIQNNSDYHCYRGSILSTDQTKQTDTKIAGTFSSDCLKELEVSLVLEPNNKNALVQLGIYHFKQSDMDLATSYLQSAIRIDPTLHLAWYYLGRIYKAIKDYKKSKDCFFTAIKLEKSNPIIPFDYFNHVEC